MGARLSGIGLSGSGLSGGTSCSSSSMEVSLDDGGDAMNDGEYLRSAEWRPVRPEPRGAVRCGAARCGAVRCGAVRCAVVRVFRFGRTRASHRRAVVGRNRRRVSRAARPARWCRL